MRSSCYCWSCSTQSRELIKKFWEFSFWPPSAGQLYVWRFLLVERLPVLHNYVLGWHTMWAHRVTTQWWHPVSLFYWSLWTGCVTIKTVRRAHRWDLIPCVQTQLTKSASIPLTWDWWGPFLRTGVLPPKSGGGPPSPGQLQTVSWPIMAVILVSHHGWHDCPLST